MTTTAAAPTSEAIALAQRHIARARRSGTLMIGDTTRGTVTLSRTEAGGFKLVAIVPRGDDTEVLADGGPRVVAPVLATLYKAEGAA